MFAPRSIKHCRACGGEVRYQTPADDNRDRATCIVCTTIHYENPLNVVGTLPVWEDQVLLCRRNIEPRKGLWTLPAGFMENNESATEGAAREALEEANARVEIIDLYTVYSIPHIIAFCSDFTTLVPGDVIATGTPEGVGHRRNPQLWMKPGDVLEVEITGIGTLRSRIVDEKV